MHKILAKKCIHFNTRSTWNLLYPSWWNWIEIISRWL